MKVDERCQLCGMDGESINHILFSSFSRQRLWKTRNLYLFEGKSFSALETITKIRDDVLEWNEAQLVKKSDDENEDIKIFDNHTDVAGCAWVLRDCKGVVLLHSRRAFADIYGSEDAKLKGLLWAIESMGSHKMKNVIFAVQSRELVEAANRPKTWPSFKYQSSEILKMIGYVYQWKVEMETKEANRGAYLIAQSVTDELRVQSYVASSHPRWLNSLFVDE